MVEAHRRRPTPKCICMTATSPETGTERLYARGLRSAQRDPDRPRRPRPEGDRADRVAIRPATARLTCPWTKSGSRRAAVASRHGGGQGCATGFGELVQRFETTTLAVAPERHGSQAAGEQTASDPLDHTPTDPRSSHILSGLTRKFAHVLAARIRSLSENASTSSVATETPACRPMRACRLTRHWTSPTMSPRGQPTDRPMGPLRPSSTRIAVTKRDSTMVRTA